MVQVPPAHPPLQNGESTEGVARRDLDEHRPVRQVDPQSLVTAEGRTPNRALSAWSRRFYTCTGTFTLAVPYTQRFFQLACPADVDGRGAGHVGMLTSNSFTRREFGRRLATEFLAEEVTLTHILDASGAYIPGHGTPTVLLVGRNRRPDVSQPVVVVLAERAEPTLPPIPGAGQVWQSIRRHARTAGLADRWTRSMSLDRRVLSEFPWQLTDSTARALIARMSGRSELGDVAIRIGYSAHHRRGRRLRRAAGRLPQTRPRRRSGPGPDHYGLRRT